MNLQTSYASGPALGFPGQVASAELANFISRTVETAAGLAFGQPAFRGAGEHGCVAGAAFGGTSVSSADATNIGTTTISATPAVAAPAIQGRHVIVQQTTGNTGVVNLYDPAGLLIGDGVVGTAFTLGGLGPITLTAAGTPTAGDRWYVDVTYTANAKFLGLAKLTQAVATATVGAAPDAYRQYDSAPLMTVGPMWLLLGATVVPGGLVYWDPATLKYSSDVTKVRIPNARWDTGGVLNGLSLVDLRLRDA